VRILLLSMILGLAMIEFRADAEEKTGAVRPAAENAGRPAAPVLLSVEVVPDPSADAQPATNAKSARLPARPLRTAGSDHQVSTDSTEPRSIAR
jgi:hypothetical protein